MTIYKMKRVHLIIFGKVQGVCFRLNTEKIANKLGVKGYVKNLPNGSVEVVAEGKRNLLGDLIAFCRKGNGSAEVTNILIEFKKPTKEFDSFIIKDEVKYNGINRR